MWFDNIIILQNTFYYYVYKLIKYKNTSQTIGKKKKNKLYSLFIIEYSGNIIRLKLWIIDNNQQFIIMKKKALKIVSE